MNFNALNLCFTVLAIDDIQTKKFSLTTSKTV